MTLTTHRVHPYGRPKIQIDLDSIELYENQSASGGVGMAVRFQVKRIGLDGKERTEAMWTKDWAAIALAKRVNL
jgi:hypothetical protein